MDDLSQPRLETSPV